ncbi:hypothetical protein BD560DRAFT_431377 [Blakeslea trispora]|nr:hypothetical protein BD560DRAFT_431377 [Blakeslea trispora]
MSAASPSANSPMSMVASPSADIPMVSRDVSEELETQRKPKYVQHSASPLPRNHDALDAQIRYLFTSSHLG